MMDATLQGMAGWMDAAGHRTVRTSVVLSSRVGLVRAVSGVIGWLWAYSTCLTGFMTSYRLLAGGCPLRNGCSPASYSALGPSTDCCIRPSLAFGEPHGHHECPVAGTSGWEFDKPSHLLVIIVERHPWSTEYGVTNSYCLPSNLESCGFYQV